MKNNRNEAAPIGPLEYLSILWQSSFCVELLHSLNPKNPAPAHISCENTAQHRAQDTRKRYDDSNDGSKGLQEPHWGDLRQNDH